MDINKMREQFEHHVRKGIWGEHATTEKCLCLARQGDGYEQSSVNRDWLVWKASREAVEIELPETPNRGIGYGLFDAGKEACRSALEAQGLKVKP